MGTEVAAVVVTAGEVSESSERGAAAPVGGAGVKGAPGEKLRSADKCRLLLSSSRKQVIDQSQEQRWWRGGGGCAGEKAEVELAEEQGENT